MAKISSKFKVPLHNKFYRVSTIMLKTFSWNFTETYNNFGQFYIYNSPQKFSEFKVIFPNVFIQGVFKAVIRFKVFFAGFQGGTFTC